MVLSLSWNNGISNLPAWMKPFYSSHEYPLCISRLPWCMTNCLKNKTHPDARMGLFDSLLIWYTDYRVVLSNPVNTFRYVLLHLFVGLIWVFSPISFQLMTLQPSGFDAMFPFQILRSVSPLRRGMQLPVPLRSWELKPGARGAYQRLAAACTISPISLIRVKDWGFK